MQMTQTIRGRRGEKREKSERRMRQKEKKGVFATGRADRKRMRNDPLLVYRANEEIYGRGRIGTS